MSVGESVDTKELSRAAHDMQLEIQKLKEKNSFTFQPNQHRENPRFYHRYWDRFWMWRMERRATQKPATPLITRAWVPWVLTTGLVAIWIPDSYKIKFLYAVDEWNDSCKLKIHCWYWKMTMPTAQYAKLMEQLEQNVPKTKRVESPNCPL